MNEYLKSGKQAIRLLYFLIISLALTNALSNLFTKETIFSTFELPNFEKIILFLIFFSFISRFFMGAYRVLSQDIEIEIRRYKIVIDILGFSFQALLFYVYSIKFYDLHFSYYMILILCIIDSIWLIILMLKGIKDSTSKEWLIHNILMVLFVLRIFYYNNYIDDLHCSYFLFIVAYIGLITDFKFNHEFYLPSKKGPALRFFIAGPYGDTEPQEIINKNVEIANNIGKQIALKGHFPFIPHKMLHGWERDGRFSEENFKRIDNKWLEFCDAIFFISESKGANEELVLARSKGLQIFKDIEEVPVVK